MTRPAQVSLTRLEEIVGVANVSTDSAALNARQVDGTIPLTVVQPADATQVAEIVRFAAAERLAVIPSGSATKLGIGSPASRYDISLDLSRMNRILAYDPQDLTLGVEPGARITDVMRVLAEQKQFLPLAVPFADRATIGGIVGANSSSPLRHAYGGVRDFCLGMEFVTGEGVTAKSGGRVVKNVTGYDLHKLLIGSLGTLAVITRANFRTFPLPAAQGTFAASFSDKNLGSDSAADAVFGFCRAISHSVLAPQMVEVADPAASRLLFSSHSPARIEGRTWSVVISAAGQPEVVARYAHELGHMATKAGAEEFLPLDEVEGNSVFARIREFPKLVLEAAPSAALFRIGVTPTAMATLACELRRIAAARPFDLVTLASASGILYAALLPQEGESPSLDTRTTTIQKVFQECGHPEINASAMLEWCPPEIKRTPVAVWGPPRQDFALMRRVKHAFDPNDTLSPGRFAGEG